MLFRERQLMNSFKPGDWIQCTYANGTKFVAQVVSETSVKEAGRVYPTTLDSDWVAWQPKVGEWVWSKGSYTQAFIFKWTSSHEQAGIINYTNYEPFIERLPTFIKDQS